MILDSHHHLWRFDPARLPWISEAMPALRQDYGLADLEAALAGTGVDRTILVHAQQRIDETEWMLGLAAASARIAGVVGWVPLVAPDLEDTLSRLTADRRLRGVRHIVHDEPDDDYLLRDDVNRGVARLRRHGLVYDVLIFAKHLPQAIAFVDRHPEQPFVVDHVAKPTIRAGHFDTRWAEGLRAIAERPHVSCKLSGMVTEVRDGAWTPALLQPYVDVALEAFGPSRLMFGTDWPVCRLRCEYADWVAAVRSVHRPALARRAGGDHGRHRRPRLRSVMQQVVLVEPGRFALRDVDAAAPGRGRGPRPRPPHRRLRHRPARLRRAAAVLHAIRACSATSWRSRWKRFRPATPACASAISAPCARS